MATFEATRPAVGAQALGVARAAYEYSLDYAKERHAFGKPIIMNQAIAFKLANMATEIDASRLLIWRAAWLAKNGTFKNGEGSMSKWKASETAVRVTEDAIQILGGYGYTREYPVERWHRDAKIHTIFEGTSEIQQLVIAGRSRACVSSDSGARRERGSVERMQAERVGRLVIETGHDDSDDQRTLSWVRAPSPAPTPNASWASPKAEPGSVRVPSVPTLPSSADGLLSQYVSDATRSMSSDVRPRSMKLGK